MQAAQFAVYKPGKMVKLQILCPVIRGRFTTTVNSNQSLTKKQEIFKIVLTNDFSCGIITKLSLIRQQKTTRNANRTLITEQYIPTLKILQKKSF
jgi:hypothetical protein